MPDRSSGGAASADSNGLAWHGAVADEVLEALDVDPEHGLSPEEVEARRGRHGRNELPHHGGRSAFRRALDQVNQPLILILLVASAVSAVLEEWVDASVIFGVVFLNGLIGYLQEAKALQALAALSRTVVTTATAFREGAWRSVPSADLVPGDIVSLAAGDRVPADLRLIDVSELATDESALTGESVPVDKAADPLGREAILAERHNMAYASTLVSRGQGVGVVVATGGETEVGRISELMRGADVLSTPLTRRIALFSRQILVAVLVLAALTFAVGTLRGEEAREMFIAAVALAVGAIPEGLPAAITVTLAVGVSRMAQRRAIIRSLPAVETLGSTTVVCSDKTGTLTENQMTVGAIHAGGEEYDVTGQGYEPVGEIEPAPAGSHALTETLTAGLLCNDARLIEEDGRWTMEGDPTEAALLVSARKGLQDWEERVKRLRRASVLPFDSSRQYMATAHLRDDASAVVYVKGSVESITRRCSEFMQADGSLVPFDADRVVAEAEALAGRGLRVLTFARTELPPEEPDLGHDDLDGGLVFLGLQGMIDPPRAEAIPAVQACQGAGVDVKMITGDHALTARAIARQLGIGGDEPETLTGADLERMDMDELRAAAAESSVFARVEPHGKLRLVRALQQAGHVVAMTGDGVNDAPALRQADIGIAMGRTGTEVAREAGDVVLTDDNFATIEAAIEEGRGVYDNVTKFIQWTLPTNLAEGLVILTAVFLGTTLPILPVQILWVNMATAVFLGMTLAVEPKEQGIMKRSPRDPTSGLIDLEVATRVILVGLIILIGAFTQFEIAQANGWTDAEARTLAINVIVLVETVYLFNCRSASLPPWRMGTTNWWMIGGVIVMLVAQALFTYAPPMQAAFGTASMPAFGWVAAGGVAFVAFWVVELEKFIRRSRNGMPSVSEPEPAD